MEALQIEWLLNSAEPWTRLRTRCDLLGLPLNDPQVIRDRHSLVEHPDVQALIRDAQTWPGYPIRRHNDASHPLYKLVVLADFGLRHTDFDFDSIFEQIHLYQSQDGAFSSLVNIPAAFGGSGQDSFAWMACDAPVLLYVLLTLGPGESAPITRAIEHLLAQSNESGWGCSSGGAGHFRGPGKRGDPCPIANLLALKAISCIPDLLDSIPAHRGVEMLLKHWQERREKKYYLFGMGTDFCKLKYPFIWYDILHAADVLRRFPFVHLDLRFQEMLTAIEQKMDVSGHFKPESMYQAWKGWSFADKKNASAWISLLAHRCLLNRI